MRKKSFYLVKADFVA